MTKNKFFSDAEDSGREGGGGIWALGSRRHVTSHSNARAIQLVAGHRSADLGRRTGSMAGVDTRPHKGANKPVEVGSLLDLNVADGIDRSLDISVISNNGGHQLHNRSKYGGGLAGLFSRKAKQKSSSTSFMSNSSSEGANSELSESEDGLHQKKSKKDKTKLLSLIHKRAASEAEGSGKVDDGGKARSPRTAGQIGGDDGDEMKLRRRRLKKLQLIKVSSDRDAPSTASDTDSYHGRHYNKRQQQIARSEETPTKLYQLQSHTLDRHTSSKRTELRTDQRVLTAVQRSGSGQLLVSKNPVVTANPIVKGRRQRSPDATKSFKEADVTKNSGYETITKYPKYKGDTLRGSLWLNGTMKAATGSNGEGIAVRPSVVEYCGQQDHQPTVRNSNEQPIFAKSDKDATYQPSTTTGKQEKNSFVGGHYAPILDKVLDNSQTDSKNRTNAAPLRQANVADKRRSTSTDRQRQSAVSGGRIRSRHLSAADSAGKRRNNSAAGAQSAERVKNANSVAASNNRQSKSAENLSPRPNRRDEGGAPKADHRKPEQQQQQHLVMRTITIKLSGKRDAGHPDQYDHLHEKSKRSHGDTMGENSASGTAGGKLSSSLPDLKKDSSEKGNQAPGEEDNVYRPVKGNMPRADSTDSLMLLVRKDQFDFLSEKDRKGETIDSTYWKGDMARFQTGTTRFLRQQIESTNATSCEILSDEGSGYSSNSDTPSMQAVSDERRSDLKKWISIETYNSTFLVPRRPLIGSTERHRFVRRKTPQRTSVDDLYGRVTNDNDLRLVREAPCIRSTVTNLSSTLLLAEPPKQIVEASETMTKSSKVRNSSIQPVVTHDFAEVVSFFSQPLTGSTSRDKATFISEAVITGTWQWNGGKPVGESTDQVDSSKPVTHFRDVSTCRANSSSGAPTDRFRLISGSVAPAESWRSRTPAKRSTVTSSRVYTGREPSTTKTSWQSSSRPNYRESDEGIMGYRRYLVSGSPSVPRESCSYRVTSSNTSKPAGIVQGMGGLWHSLWSSHSRSDGHQIIHTGHGDGRSRYDTEVNEREMSTSWPFSSTANICDYIAGMLLGMVVVLLVGYLPCYAC